MRVIEGHKAWGQSFRKGDGPFLSKARLCERKLTGRNTVPILC